MVLLRLVVRAVAPFLFFLLFPVGTSLGEVRRPGSTAGVRVICIPGWGFSGGPSGFLIQRFVAGLPGVTGVAGPRSGGGCSWYAENVFANTAQEPHRNTTQEHDTAEAGLRREILTPVLPRGVAVGLLTQTNSAWARR